MTDPVIVGSEIRVVRDANAIAKTLSRWCTGTGSNSYHALHYEGADYQVPVDKKFICTSVSSSCGQANSKTCSINKHTVADASGGTEIVEIAGTWSTTDSTTVTGLTMPFYYEVEAGKYLNGRMQGNGMFLISVSGVEVDV